MLTGVWHYLGYNALEPSSSPDVVNKVKPAELSSAKQSGGVEVAEVHSLIFDPNGFSQAMEDDLPGLEDNSSDTSKSEPISFSKGINANQAPLAPDAVVPDQHIENKNKADVLSSGVKTIFATTPSPEHTSPVTPQELFPDTARYEIPPILQEDTVPSSPVVQEETQSGSVSQHSTSPPQSAPQSPSLSNPVSRKSSYCSESSQFSDILDHLPLNMLFGMFSKRATKCLSTFDPLADGALARNSMHGSIKLAESSPTTSSILPVAKESEDTTPTDLDIAELMGRRREPSQSEIRFVETMMKRELQLVEKAIDVALIEEQTKPPLQISALRKSSVTSIIPLKAEEVFPTSLTYFDTMDMSFSSVQISENGVDTLQVLLAIESLLTMFEQFASTAFALVQNEILTDIRKIRGSHAVSPEKCQTLQGLLAFESTQRRKLGTESVVWLHRNLKFLSRSLRLNMDSPGEELSVSFTRAWDEEYSKYCSWLVRPLFKLLIRACPTRTQFYNKLGGDSTAVDASMKQWLHGMEAIVNNIGTFIVAGKYNKGY